MVDKYSNCIRFNWIFNFRFRDTNCCKYLKVRSLELYVTANSVTTFFFQLIFSVVHDKIIDKINITSFISQ